LTTLFLYDLSFRRYLTTNVNRRPQLRPVEEWRPKWQQVQSWRAENVVDMTSLLRYVPRESKETKKNRSQYGVKVSEFAAGDTEA